MIAAFLSSYEIILFKTVFLLSTFVKRIFLFLVVLHNTYLCVSLTRNLCIDINTFHLLMIIAIGHLFKVVWAPRFNRNYLFSLCLHQNSSINTNVNGTCTYRHGKNKILRETNEILSHTFRNFTAMHNINRRIKKWSVLSGADTANNWSDRIHLVAIFVWNSTFRLSR